jgi:hypothetical protein
MTSARRAHRGAFTGAIGALCALLAGHAASTPSASSEAPRTSRVQHFVVGASPGFASGEWLDAHNSSRSRVRLPRAPTINFRLRLTGGIGQAPASDSDGNLIVVQGEPRVTKLDARGKTLWSERLRAEASGAPVITSSGSILIVTRSANALLFDPFGRLLFDRPLALSEPRHRTLTIALTNGGALVASGRELLELTSAAQIARQSHLPANVVSVAEWGAQLLAVCDTGALALAHATGGFEPIGSLGGSVEGAALEGDSLNAVVDAHRLVAFDLRTHQIRLLAADPTLELAGVPALFSDRGSAVVADGGFLSFRSSSGAERQRLSLGEPGRAVDPTTRALHPALLIVDPAGGVATTRSGSDALLFQPDGSSRRLEGTTCLDPWRPTPGRDGVFLTCRSGQIFGVSEGPPPQASPQPASAH